MMIRTIFLLLLAMLITNPARAAEAETLPFANVQVECNQVGEITFGPGGHWAHCHTIRGRWVATMDLLDTYQAQYCLGKDENSCDQKALVIFANRAYTPEAAVLLVRVDDGTITYDDPLVVESGDESVMSITSHDAAGVATRNFYLWRVDHWQAMKGQELQRELSAFLPKGSSVRQASVFPDLETMSTQVSLFQPKDADCCPSGGKANVEFGLEKEQFTIKQVNTQATEAVH
jgi:hypothetical protein